MNGLILAFDTSTDRCALALGRVDGTNVNVEAEADFDAPRAALSRLLPAVEELLSAHSFSPSDLSAILIGRGPGSFTGVRIGVSIAKGLAHGLSVPLYGIGSLDAIAWRSVEREGLLGVLGDAMRSEVYPALFRLADGVANRLGPDYVGFPDGIAGQWASENAEEAIVVTGDALAKHQERFEEALGERLEVLDEPLWWPSGAGLLAAFGAALAAGEHGDGDPGSLLPIYTRLSDAEEAVMKRPGDGS